MSIHVASAGGQGFLQLGTALYTPRWTGNDELKEETVPEVRATSMPVGICTANFSLLLLWVAGAAPLRP